MLDLKTSLEMAETMKHHVGLHRLFESHSWIAKNNPAAFDRFNPYKGQVIDAGMIVEDTVDTLNTLFGYEPSAVNNLMKKQAYIDAFINAVADIEWAAAFNIGGLAEQGLTDRLILRMMGQGLDLSGGGNQNAPILE